MSYIETTVLEVNKNDEIQTINRYQKMGWHLKSNQEVKIVSQDNGNTVQDYMRLTFERDHGMKNFEELDRCYQSFCALQARKDAIHKQIRNAGFNLKRALILFAALAVVGFFFFGNLLDILEDMDGMDFFLNLMLAVCVGALGFFIEIFLGMIDSNKAEKLHAPALAQLETQMEQVTNEAAGFLE